MDGWPKQGTEPKAPDKTHLHHMENPKRQDGHIEYDNSRLSIGTPHESTVSSLDESGLKDLLEEALTFRRRKDIDTKSELFKELFHKVESDNKFPGRDRPEKAHRKSRRRLNKKDADKSCSHGSLQDLIDSQPPSNLTTDDSKGKETLPKPLTRQNCDHNDVTAATNDETKSDFALENGNFENMKQLMGNDVYKQMESVDSSIGLPLRRTLPNNYLDEPDVELSESFKSVKALIPTVEKALEENLAARDSFSEKQKNFDENGNSLSSALLEKKGKSRRLKAKNDKNTILSQHIEGHRSDIAQDIDALMEYIESPTDEGKVNRQRHNVMNFNKNSPRISNSSKLRHTRDKSSDTLRKSKKSKESEFHKSSSLEEVCISKFEDLTGAGKNSQKSNESTLHTSHEPVRLRSDYESIRPVSPVYMNMDSSRTKKEALDCENIDSDFLTVTKKQRRRKTNTYIVSNSNRNRVHNFNMSHKQDKPFYSYESKQRGLYSFERNRQRRKSTSSVPSSEKSGESSDLDSVHSLPVSTSKARSMHAAANSDVSPASKNVSYAAIAKSSPSPSPRAVHSTASSDLSGEKLSFEQEASPEPIPTVLVSLPKKEKGKIGTTFTDKPDEYPPLSSDSPVTTNDMFVEFTVIVPKKDKNPHSVDIVNVDKTIVVKTPPGKPPQENPSPSPVQQSTTASLVLTVPAPVLPLPTVTVKRPPVILMSENKDSSLVKDLEFGFEVNQQLLSGMPSPDDNTESPPEKLIECETEIATDESAVSVESSPPLSSTSSSPPTETSSTTPVDSTVKPLPVVDVAPSPQKLAGLSPHLASVYSLIMTEWDAVIAEYSAQIPGGPARVQYYSP